MVPGGARFAWHAHGRPWLAALVLGWCVGCALPRRAEPVSQPLVKSRRLTQQALNFLERQQPARAEELLAQAVQTCPHDPEARRAYSEVLWQTGRQQEALEHLTEAIQLLPEDAALIRRWAEMRFALGDTGVALRAAEDALDLQPQDSAAWLLRGRVLRREGDLPAALAAYQRSLALDGRNRETLLEIAEVYQQLGQPARSLANLNGLLELYPADEEPPEVLFRVGMAYASLGYDDTASEYLWAARRRGGPRPDVLYQLAQLHLRRGQTEAARRALDELLLVAPEHLGARALHERMAALPAAEPPVHR